MKDLVKTTSAIGITEIALIFVAIVKNKYLAISIGPEGLGIFSLLSSFFGLSMVFSGSCLATGATKYIAEYKKEDDIISIQKIYSFSIGFTTILAVIISILLIINKEQLIKIFLAEEVLSIYFTLFAVAFIGKCLRPVFISMLQGLQEVKVVVVYRILISIFEIVTVIVFVYLFDLTGLFISILLVSIFSVIILWKQLNKFIKYIFELPKFKDKIYHGLLTFGLVNFFLTFVNIGGQYLLRIIILKNIDMKSVGLLHAGIAIMNYLGISGRGLNFYALPKMSEKMNNDDRIYNINEILRFAMLIGLPISLFALLFGKEIILLLFSFDFVQLTSSLFLFVIASYLTTIGMVFQSTYLGMANLKIHAILSISLWLLLVSIPFYFAKDYGISSVGAAYLIVALLSNISMIIFFIHKIKLKFSLNIKLLFLVSGASLITAVLLKNTHFFTKVFVFVITLFLLSTTIKKKEYLKVFSIIKLYLKK